MVSIGAVGRIDDDQFYLLTEGIFFSIFRTYENTIEKIFVNYMLGERSSLGRRPHSYVLPRDYDHARKLVKSNSSYIDWISPSNLIDRSELYFREGFLIKPAIVSNQEDLMDMVRLRNHIAHNSDESLHKYKVVLRNRLRTVPVIIPSVGEFLNKRLISEQSNYFLRFYFDRLHTLIYELTH